MKISILYFLISLSFVEQEDSLVQKLPEAGLSFSLPNSEWHMVAHQENEKTSVYHYKRSPIEDSEGRVVIPNMAFIIESLDEEIDVVTYSAQKRSQVPFEVEKVFTSKDDQITLNLAQAIGYKGSYIDKSNLKHGIYVLHILGNGKGIQVICDITLELFPEYEDEFLKVVATLQQEGE